MDPLNAPVFLLRRKGQVVGPFPRTRILLMARRGEVLLTDDLSLNGGPWVPAAQTPLAEEIVRARDASAKAPAPGAAQDASPAEAAPASDAFTDWAQGEAVYTSRHARRKPRRRSGGGGSGISLEAALLGILILLVLVGIVGAAFWMGRQTH